MSTELRRISASSSFHPSTGKIVCSAPSTTRRWVRRRVGRKAATSKVAPIAWHKSACCWHKMHVYETERDPTFGEKQRQSQLSERFLMRRQLSLLALLLIASLASACATPTAPTSNDGDEDELTCVTVVVGTQTRCK